MNRTEHASSQIEERGHRGKPRGGREFDRRARSKPRILLVEDEIFVAWHLESVLQDMDYAVCGLAADGLAAIDQAKLLDLDLILMDIHLKGEMDGIEAARRIRRRSEAPIIFVSAYSDAETLTRVERAVPGAAVLTKPVAPARLRTAIDRALALCE